MQLELLWAGLPRICIILSWTLLSYGSVTPNILQDPSSQCRIVVGYIIVLLLICPCLVFSSLQKCLWIIASCLLTQQSSCSCVRLWSVGLWGMEIWLVNFFTAFRHSAVVSLLPYFSRQENSCPLTLPYYQLAVPFSWVYWTCFIALTSMRLKFEDVSVCDWLYWITSTPYCVMISIFSNILVLSNTAWPH